MNNRTIHVTQHDMERLRALIASATTPARVAERVIAANLRSSMLSMLTLMRERPAAFQERRAASSISEPLVVMARSTSPKAATPRMISLSRGWTVGSPPVRRILSTPMPMHTLARRTISGTESSSEEGRNRTSGSMQ